jgi:predicted unusual protein kinase regulating ubiquinone biosynthesis (AarF/ABC1/UbiB family)
MSSDKGMDKIPTSKVQRAAKIIGTSAKVGGNYVKYFAKKAINSSHTKDDLHSENANDIYKSLSELKGSALKVAQMMSMDNNVLPQAYQDKFSLAQYNAPALSFPLIQKTFMQQTGQKPHELFDSFSKEAIHAASIGQVHEARKGDLHLAVKIQYPGVADAISSDLKLVKPLAAQLLNVKSSEIKLYMDEVEAKLIEETDYELELIRSSEIAQACSSLKGLRFPRYYPELSNKRILTMDWIEGEMLPEFLAKKPSQALRNQIGQSLWDFYLYQMKVVRKVHADPHPGNFIVDSANNLCVLDFGCVKEIPSEFFDNYFQLLKPGVFEDTERLYSLYYKLDFFRKDDSPETIEFLKDVYHEMISLLSRPFYTATFDFSDKTFFTQIYTMGEGFSKNKTFRKMNNARGSKDAIYVMRTFFGLYSLLHLLEAEVQLNYTLD